MITHPLFRAAIGSSQDSVHLRLIQVRQFVPGEPLERQRAYLCTPCDVFGAALTDKASHRMDCGEPLVARADGASTVLFQVIEETTQNIARQMEDLELIDGLLVLRAGIGQQKSE